ncbi:hypothetical protein ES703_33485 [subsurface metagenome]
MEVIELVKGKVDRRNIMSEPDSEKEQVYQQIHNQWKSGAPVRTKEHKSGFPAVTVDCGDIHIITDVLSLEDFWKKLQPEEKKREVKGE